MKIRALLNLAHIFGHTPHMSSDGETVDMKLSANFTGKA